MLVLAKVSDVIRPLPAFGVAGSGTPATDAQTSSGCRPGWDSVYASVGSGLPASELDHAFGIPMLTLQPQAYGGGVYQRGWSLASTVAGKHDAAYGKVAATIRAYGSVVVVRFAAEQNGAWSPWGIGIDGNTALQYVAAWRHVVELFRAAGATNVLWLWAPNVVRGASVRGVSQFWPGSAFVDLVGVTGYGVETAAGKTYDPTLTEIRHLASKPIVLAEMGAAPGPNKAGWIRSLTPWLDTNRDVIAVVWTEQRQGVNAHHDWRFDDTTSDLAAFKTVVPHLTCSN